MLHKKMIRELIPQFTQKLTLGAVLALGATTVLPVSAEAAVNIDVRIAPPAPRIVVVPAPRPGYVWAPGYWRYRGHRHVWVDGYWIRERPGYRWEPDHWEAVGPAYRFHRGHWVR